MILLIFPNWEGQEDLIKKLQADLEEAKKLNKELQDPASPAKLGSS